MSGNNKDGLCGLAMILFPVCWAIFIHHWMTIHELQWHNVWPFAVLDGLGFWVLFGIVMAGLSGGSDGISKVHG